MKWKSRQVAPSCSYLYLLLMSCKTLRALHTFAYAQSSAFLVHFRPQRRLDSGEVKVQQVAVREKGLPFGVSVTLVASEGALKSFKFPSWRRYTLFSLSQTLSLPSVFCFPTLTLWTPQRNFSKRTVVEEVVIWQCKLVAHLRVRPYPIRDCVIDDCQSTAIDHFCLLCVLAFL